MDILVLKFIILVLLFCTSTFFGTLPYFLRKCGKTKKKFTSIVTRFLTYSQGLASGVLLGGGLLHLIPDSTEGFDESLTDMNAPDWLVSFPFASFLAICSFVSIMFCEVSVSLVFSGGAKHDHDHHHDQDYKKTDEESRRLLADGISINEDDGDDHSHSHFDTSVFNSEQPILAKLIGAIFLWGSLSMHSIFAGLALGSTTDFDSFTVLLVAIVAHKLIAAYSLGIELEQGFSSPWAFICMVYAFSASTPIGIIIGALCTMIASENAFVLVESILLAISSGAFIHVALYEFFFEFVRHNRSCCGFVFFTSLFFTGFFIMAVLTFYC